MNPLTGHVRRRGLLFVEPYSSNRIRRSVYAPCASTALTRGKDTLKVVPSTSVE